MFTQCRAAVCVTKLDVFIHVAANIDTSATAVHVQMCVCARSSKALLQHVLDSAAQCLQFIYLSHKMYTL